MVNKHLKRMGAGLSGVLSCTVFAASMAVNFAPSNAVGDGAAVTATIAYSGVAAVGNGTQVVVCYDNTKLTFGAVTYANPPGESQASQEQVSTAICVAPANRQIRLSYVSTGGTWPSNPSGSGTLAAAGNLASITFTTASPFVGSTNVVATENTALGGDYTLGTATGTLTKVIPATNATFTSAPTSLTFAEGGPVQTVQVSCAGTIGTPSPVVISVASNNTAAFTAAPASLSFTTCPSSQNVTVTPRAADALSNPTQTGNVTFGTATTGATAPASVAVTVTDNQAPAVYTITKASATVTEGSATTDTIVITCTGTLSTTPGSVSYSISGIASGTDYTATPASTVSFPACGGATQSITFSPRVDDAFVQGNRTGTLTIASPVGGTIGATSTATVAVNDDDTPQTVTVAVTNSPATEAGGVLTYTFTRAGGNAAAVAATLAVNVTPPATSTRYNTTCASTITFAANATTATCTATGVDNAVVDGNVNVVVAVAAPTTSGSYVVGAPASATGVIADDDFGITVTPSVSAIIEGQNAVFTLRCNGATGNYTVNYVITGRDAGSTVTPSATSAPLACTTGASTATVTVSTIDDSIVGNSRSVTLTLSSVVAAGIGVQAVIVGTPAAATVTVADNDQPNVIPTLGVFGLGLMSLLLAGFAAFQRRRTLK